MSILYSKKYICLSVLSKRLITKKKLKENMLPNYKKNIFHLITPYKGFEIISGRIE